MKDRIALFDMDDTIADYVGQLNKDLASISPNEVKPRVETGKHPPEISRQIDLIRNQVGWWENLPPIKSGIELMQCCKEIGYRIAILTQGPYKSRHAWHEKFNWCDRHVAPIDPNYIMNITRNGKGLVYGRVLVDDYPDYMSSWLENRPRGLGLMPEKSWNTKFEHPQVFKYNPDQIWQTPELVERLERAYKREPRES